MSSYLQEARTKAVTIPSLLAMKERGEKITMLTAYDASFASMMDTCGVRDDPDRRFARHGVPRS